MINIADKRPIHTGSAALGMSRHRTTRECLPSLLAVPMGRQIVVEQVCAQRSHRSIQELGSKSRRNQCHAFLEGEDPVPKRAIARLYNHKLTSYSNKRRFGLQSPQCKLQPTEIHLFQGGIFHFLEGGMQLLEPRRHALCSDNGGRGECSGSRCCDNVLSSSDLSRGVGLLDAAINVGARGQGSSPDCARGTVKDGATIQWTRQALCERAAQSWSH